VIYVMGNGLVLKKGTHDELLSSGGAYSSLVQAQKLCEVHENTANNDNKSSNPDEEEAMDKFVQEEIPLGSRNTGQSLASQILEQRCREQEEKKESDHSLPYLFMCMGKINHVGWTKYFWGTIFTSSTDLVCLDADLH
jgi:ATP-binding cassette, subfamily B (MDR/TAP), member 1